MSQEKDLVKTDLGADVSLEVELKDNKLQIVVTHKSTGISNTLCVPPKPVLQAIKNAIPGSIDDYLIDAAAGAVGVES